MPSRLLLTALISAGLTGALSASAAPFSYIGQQIVPTGTAAFATQVGGLSGIDYDAATNRYLAISDDRANSALGGSITDNRVRFYDLSLNLAQFTRSNTPGSAGVTVEAVTFMKKPDGTDFGTLQADPEGIRVLGNAVYWSNEGSRTAASLQNPTVRVMDRTGTHVSELSVPSKFFPAGSNSTAPGIRNNLAFESLTVSPDGSKVYTAAESALVQDGGIATLASGTQARVIEFDRTGGNALAEFVYPVSPIPVASPNNVADNGLVELIALGDRQFIAMERAFALGVGNTIKLYHADARQATDVAAADSLATFDYVPMSKTLLLDLGTLKNTDGSALVLDNVEGMTFGPTFDGKPTLILVSDNNFSGTQFTQFIALSQVAAVPEPETYALMLAGLGLVGWCARRRTAA